MDCIPDRRFGIILMILTRCFSGSDAQCNPTSGGVKRFGTNCKFRCHCLGDEQCNADTGTCTSGCDYEWTGPGCQYRNLALQEGSRHSDNLPSPKFSYLANDRDVTTCSSTNYASSSKSVAPWWALWLPNDVTFRKFEFLTMDNSLPYYPGFHVSVQKDISKAEHERKIYRNGQLCYQQDKSIPRNKTVHVECNAALLGNQIRLQLANKTTQLVICDFRVYGECKDRMWGETCQNECGLCRDLKQCNSENGHCPTGCELGYKNTPGCNEECDLGSYGDNCSAKCNINCRNQVCDKENGVCTDGCTLGYIGEMCENRCAKGYFGENCSFECGDNCLPESAKSSCNNVNGSCLNGCSAGWKGDFCETECESGKWGEGCINECGKCVNGICSRINGTCNDGCMPGYKQTAMCDQECDSGTYGINCTKTCSENCVKQRICKRTDGDCTGCQAGWRGKICNTKCKYGTFGENCSEECGACAGNESCDASTGKCNIGCRPGVKLTDRCEKECDSGTYGINCTKTCSENCVKQRICKRTDGDCTGCQAGWRGKICNTKCKYGTFGENCSEECGACAGNESCDASTGKCNIGCRPGVKLTDRCEKECDSGTYGINCTKTCSENCVKQRICKRTDGDCTGCQAGWRGKICNTKCKYGTFGENCSEECGACAGNESCDASTGKCNIGCRPGVKLTDRCEKECDSGTYGINCTKTCSENCVKQRICKRTDGDCTGCQAGWRGKICNTKCKYGTFGENCSEECGACAGNESCDASTGKCNIGCRPGVKLTDRCEKECDSGTYGINCTKTCSENCVKQRICKRTDGDCTGCQAGWRGKICNTKCKYGTFGENCSEECGACAGNESCDASTGKCNIGCRPGVKLTDRCEKECDSGTYGINCTKTCSENCVKQRICKRTDGDCTGCQAGWRGKICNTKCKYGTFGENCAEECGACAGNESCDASTGKCNIGCRPGVKLTDRCEKACTDGKYGLNCTLNCGKCKDVTGCSKATGVCEGGCLEGFTGDMCVEEIGPPAEPFPVAGVVGGTSAAFVVAGVIIAVLILQRKKRAKKENTKPLPSNDKIFSQSALTDEGVKYKKDMSKRENVYLNTSELERQKFQDNLDGTGQSASAQEESNIYANDTQEESNIYANDTLTTNQKTEREVLLSELEAYVKAGLAQKEYFAKQFQKMPYGMQYPSTIATKPVNAGKNKYKAMYAYDHSRVILDIIPGETESDYINATNIKGYSCEKAYIAAQGPNTSSLEDFWRMIWEQKIRTIVMATNLTEEGKAKCIQYWPEEGETVQMGKLIVFMESEDIFTEFTVRHLKVSHKDRPDRRRNVTQFHFQAWPDKSVPRCTSSLLHFWYQVRKHNEKKSSAWLVHCSAGVGRTGTFIALDILYDQGKDRGSVDLYQCVWDLREQRVNMVQTKDQYKFLHSIMVEALVLPWKPLHIDKFASLYAELREIDQQTGKTQLLLQYESLNEGTDVGNGPENEDDIYTSAKRTENRNKNRYDNILAPNEFRPFLFTHVTGCTDYINAVYIPGYRHKQAYIITQTPLKTTAVDCCRLIIEDKVQVIVTFADHNDEEVREYLPETGVEKIGPFTVTFVSEKDMTHFILRKYEIRFQAEKHAVTELIFKCWLPSSMTPSDPTEMLCFLQELEQMQRQNESKPVLLQCLNGAERSGLVVVLMNILERVRFDNEVSIIQVIRQLKIRRQQIIPNLEQFQFCHDVLLSHIQSNSTYANT